MDVRKVTAAAGETGSGFYQELILAKTVAPGELREKLAGPN